MNDYIYEISNLDCDYGNHKIVLHIDTLNIPRGKIVFFVGPSGIGKSTVLETLGFMTKTVVLRDETLFRYDGRDVKGVWNMGDKELSSFRMRNFSFVFQENNLMPNFKAYDNIVTPAAFQGMDYRVVRNKVKEMLRLVGIKDTNDKDISEYSGGERQRLALVRAILPDFSVLFADEPTGNLDCINADKLMKLIVDSVTEKKSTAIIVSHDIDLSVKYADIIVLIRKDPNNEKRGIIDDESVFLKRDCMWTNLNEPLNDVGMRALIKQNLRDEQKQY